MSKQILCIITTTVFVDGTTKTETENYITGAGVQANDDTNLDNGGNNPPPPPHP